ncbi:MAG: L,D-transpeptidase family protein [Chitinispirillaceae bacterium]|nr:L,D-transpeptidase family protein [Chitinispirillaceae bacterium]
MEPGRFTQICKRLKTLLPDTDEIFLYVNTVDQELSVCRGTSVIERFAVSTSVRGLGNREGSNKTPTGLHRISEKLGAGAPAARIFRDRTDTGRNWLPGGSGGQNLILARILRLEGLEPGLNRGPHIDSYERYIYIHGTNREEIVGTPLSHGCVVLRGDDIIRVFDMVNVGALVYIDAAILNVNGHWCSHIHFAGIFGSGMSALAQYLQWNGTMVSGSDRLMSNADTAVLRDRLDKAGCSLFTQDGSGISFSTDAVCVSTAIEESNPDIAAARSRNLPVFHRSDVLAAAIDSKQTIAVAGTSGKSTVTAMVFEFLTACGRSPSLITGAPLVRLEQEGLIGNAFAGSSELLVVEADESDGTIVKYRPAAGIVLNISRDHKSIEEIERLFQTFAVQSCWAAVNADDAGLARIGAQERFGASASATWRPERIELSPDSVTVYRGGIAMHLPLPGAHNAQNLCAALCICEHFGCASRTLASAVRAYKGVARRFALTRTCRHVTVADDFAHNPAKIAAAVKTARGISRRIIAVYQPHGFGPTKFLKGDYISTFRAIFNKHDSLYLLPIYYAGGTAVKDISSEDIICGLGKIPFHARAVNDRDTLLSMLSNEAGAGDCVLLMGARDHSLASLAQKIIAVFGGAAGESPRTSTQNTTP